MVRTLLAAVMCLLASACSTTAGLDETRSSTSEPASSSTLTSSNITTTSTAPVEPRGVVRVVQPNWDQTMMVTSIVAALLEEVGYEVEHLSRDEGTDPYSLYGRIASGDAELTFEALLPDHERWFDAPTWSGSPELVRDQVTVIEPPMTPAGMVQGFLVSKSWAEAEGITHVGQINADPALAAALDADGNGKGELYGCPRDWTCDDVMDSFVHFNNWDSLEQWTDLPSGVQRPREIYDAMFESFLERVDRGEAAVAYVWTPTSFYADAAIGEKTMWLSVSDEAALNGTRYLYDSPHDPQEWLLNPDGTAGFSDVAPETCTQGPDGCQLGWKGSSIHSVANAEWLVENAPAEKLLAVVELDTVEISELQRDLEVPNLEERPDEIDASWDIARRWIEDNRDRVDVWISAALNS